MLDCQITYIFKYWTKQNQNANRLLSAEHICHCLFGTATCLSVFRPLLDYQYTMA
jgi:hypothetical protein